MYLCPECKTENRGNARFCRNCGATRKIAEVSDEGTDRCPSCVRRVRHTDRYCINCGESLAELKRPNTKICLSCKTICTLRSSFCMNCGEYVGTKSTKQMELPTEVSKDNPDATQRKDP